MAGKVGFVTLAVSAHGFLSLRVPVLPLGLWGLGLVSSLFVFFSPITSERLMGSEFTTLRRWEVGVGSWERKRLI